MNEGNKGDKLGSRNKGQKRAEWSARRWMTGETRLRDAYLLQPPPLTLARPRADKVACWVLVSLRCWFLGCDLRVCEGRKVRFAPNGVGIWAR